MTGLFGKLPAHGDFIRRALPRSFTAPWDAWVSHGMEAARATLGEGWTTAWKGAPAWRFRLSPGRCGPDAAVGVMVMSADMVGRRFPLALVAILPAAAIPPADEWYEALEAAARTEGLDADALLARLPSAPPDESDATLDGRSLFWTAGGPARPMPGPAEFQSLLGAPDAPPAALPFAAPVEPVLAVVAEEPIPDAAALSGIFAAPLPFAPQPLADQAAP